MGEAMSASTQMSDWALKEAGAAVDLQRSSSSSAGLCRVFWFLCAPAPQDTFVQPDALPGYYWPFQWSRSKRLIRSPTQIQATAITRDQTSKMASALGTVSSAPRDFIVSGPDEEGEQETLLGTFTYTLQKGPNQSFPLQNGIPRGFRFLKLGLQSNWGKPCIECGCMGRSRSPHGYLQEGSARTHTTPAAEGGHLSLRESFVAREDGEKKTGQGQPGKVSAGSGHQTAQARTPQACRKEANEIVTSNVKRIFTILFLLNLAALASLLPPCWGRRPQDSKHCQKPS
ncbi:sperm-associated antigen 4 protein-like [Rissa tridactyla]|uniref:sperm-associated antigen 4 protein-like n=1 Tax=Rissa tridactyla TaxID=75485 RepID=UPI0023BACF8D|nr:sperm-associated antigen 4 protein-like [Rissa tridactyla]XP_054042959.1 sperm-associated antigen 4 protein-like [Rissa tridactyla]